jgi:biopolymer transport protein ExbB/TolQ
MNLSFWEMIKLGGVAMYAIIGMSILAIAVAAERVSALWRFGQRAKSLAETVNRCLGRGAVAEARTACERSKSPLADVFLVGFERRGRSTPDVLASSVDRERQRVVLDLKTRLWILGTIGATAPFVGLYGTVVGIMEAFKSIQAAGQGGLSVVQGGLAEALITTAAGIAVAIEAVILYNFFNQRLVRLNAETRFYIEEFIESLNATKIDELPRTGEQDGAGQAAG